MKLTTPRLCGAILCTLAACGAASDDDGALAEDSQELTASWATQADSCGCVLFTGTISKTVRVPAGGDLQAAINAAASGTEIVLDAGATYTGNYYLPKKSITSYITIRSSAPLNPCLRVTPSDRPSLARINAKSASLPVFRTAAGAHHYRLVNLEIAAPGAYAPTLVQIGTGVETSTSQSPTHFILDRLYIHGDATRGGKRGVSLNGSTLTVQNSWIADLKSTSQDTQAISGWNGAGNFVIANNYLEAAAENVLFGGTDPEIDDLVPANIKIRFNHFAKPLKWRPGDPSYAGTHWVVKNLLELKNARSVTIEGNLFEQNWPDAQKGFAIVFTPRNQTGGATWTRVTDVTFRRNLVRKVAAAVNILGHDDVYRSGLTQNIRIEDNLFHDVGGSWGTGSSSSGRLFQLASGTNDPGPSNVVINHNTGLGTGYFLLGVGGSGAIAKPGFVFTNQLVKNGAGLYGDGAGSTATALASNFPSAVFTANAVIGGSSSSYSGYPGNFFPSLTSVGFVGDGDYALKSSSTYADKGTDGRDLGASSSYLDDASQCH